MTTAVDALPFELLAITDPRLGPGRLVAQVLRLLAAHPTVRIAVQLRDKAATTRELLALAHALREATAARGALLFVNGRLDVARAVGADGVHLGHDAPRAADVRRVAPSLLVGLSTHGDDPGAPDELAAADFVTLSPVFPTTKAHAAQPLGTARLARAVAVCPKPVVALGGIGPTNAFGAWAAGAAAVAAISSWLLADDPAQSALAMGSTAAESRKSSP